MKIIAKAKPVKIRIKSGGEEHSSLESLKRNFSFKDIEPLLDGRLSRWLKQQGQAELAQDVCNFRQESLKSESNMLSFINLFFSSEIPENVHTLIDLAKFWETKDRYKKNSDYLYRYLLYENVEMAKYIYINSLIKGVDWIRVFSKYEKNNDGELLFILGKIWIEDKHKIKEGMEYIDRSIALGYSYATEYRERQKEKRNGINRKKLLFWINKNWSLYDKMELQLTNVDFNEIERNVLNFVFQCQMIVFDLNCNSVKYVLEKLDTYFNEDSKKMFGNEICFFKAILCMGCSWTSIANSLFLQIKDSYPLAEYMLSDKIFFHDMNFKEMSTISKISFIVKHLFDYE